MEAAAGKPSDLDLDSSFAAEVSERSESTESGWSDLFSLEEWETLTGNHKPTSHVVTIEYPPGQFEGNDNRYELDCDSCGHIGAVDTLECAEAVARLHEEFVATLVTAYEVPA